MDHYPTSYPINKIVNRSSTFTCERCGDIDIIYKMIGNGVGAIRGVTHYCVIKYRLGKKYFHSNTLKTCPV